MIMTIAVSRQLCPYIASLCPNALGTKLCFLCFAAQVRCLHKVALVPDAIDSLPQTELNEKNSNELCCQTATDAIIQFV